MINKLKLQAAKLLGVASALAISVYGLVAKAALDADVEAVASTTLTTMKTNSVDLLKYMIPSALIVFFVWFAWKFGMRIIRRFMH